MTLITHFRTKEYAVVAADTLITSKSIGNKYDNKLASSTDMRSIVACYGSMCYEALNYTRCTESIELKEIQSILEKHQINSNPSGILFVSKEKSVLFHKNIIDYRVAEIEIAYK